LGGLVNKSFTYAKSISSDARCQASVLIEPAGKHNDDNQCIPNVA